MRTILLVFLFVAVVAIIGIIQETKSSEEYNFPTADAVLHRCRTNADCGELGWCENVDGSDGGYDGRRGRQCRAKFPMGVSCFEDAHCRSGYCNRLARTCDAV